MEWAYTPYVLPFLLSAAASGVIGVYLCGQRSRPGAAALAILSFSVTFWSICLAVETGSLSLTEKIAWSRLGVLGLAGIPVSWLVFSGLQAGYTDWGRLRHAAFFAILPGVTLAVTATNAYHGLMSSAEHLVWDQGIPTLVQDYGGWYWVFALYSILAALAGGVILLRATRQAAQLVPRALPAVAGAVGLACLGAAAAFFPGRLPLVTNWGPPLDALAAGILTWTLFRPQPVGRLPVASRAAIENLPDGLLILDPDDRLIDLNPAAAQLLRVEPAEALGEKIDFLLARFPRRAQPALSSRDALVEVTFGEGDQARWFEVRTSPLTSGPKGKSGKLVLMHEITSWKRVETELEKSHALLLATLEATADGILVNNLRGKPIRYNRRMVEMWRIPEAVLTDPDDEAMTTFIADQVANPAAFYQLANRMTTEPDAESYDAVELKDGRVFERYSRPQRVGDKRSGRVWSFHDITEQRRGAEKLRFLTTHDVMTGLYNRVFFEEEINRLDGSRQYPISIIMADVDGLKETNDVYGHGAGDALLRRAAEVLRQACRQEDMVARLGGDEFGIILPYSGADVAARAIQRIQFILPTLKVDEKEIPVSLSLGAATGEAGQSLRMVLREADQAMYEAKRAKRQRRARGALLAREPGD